MIAYSVGATQDSVGRAVAKHEGGRESDPCLGVREPSLLPDLEVMIQKQLAILISGKLTTEELMKKQFFCLWTFAQLSLSFFLLSEHSS